MDFNNTDVLSLIFLRNIVTNLVALSIFCYVIFFRRYHDKEAATTFALFNITLFAIVTIVIRTNLGIAIGFGLFALLSIVRLRSEAIKMLHLSYFFGSLSLAVINAVGVTDYLLVIICNLLILLGAWIINHPNILPNSENLEIILGGKNLNFISNEAEIREKIKEFCGIDATTLNIVTVDVARKKVVVNITYTKHNGDTT